MQSKWAAQNILIDRLRCLHNNFVHDIGFSDVSIAIIDTPCQYITHQDSPQEKQMYYDPIKKCVQNMITKH